MNPKKIIEHIKLCEKLKDKKLAAECIYNKDRGFSEVLVCTMGKAGLFSKIAGTLASKNLNIMGARIYTRRDGIAIDTIQVTGIDGAPMIDKHMWGRIEADLLDVIEERKDVEELIDSRYNFMQGKKNAGSKIEPEITVDNSISDTHTVIETIIEDRIGVLYAITNQMFNMGIDIYLARISTEANRGISVFYVTDLKGAKIVDENVIHDIISGLEEVLLT